MKRKKLLGAVLALIMAASSLNIVFSAEALLDSTELVVEESTSSDSALEISQITVGQENETSLETINQVDLATYTDTYEVEGGYIYFDADTGAITDADTSITNADIPSEISGVSVTSIGNNAFNGCRNLISIIIPDGTANIGNNAFYNCNHLTNITIPDSVTSIGEDAFYNCYNLTNISIPDSVTSIGEAAFASCQSLISITIPNGITSIYDGTFAHCHNLMSITIPDSVTSIGEYAFNSCYVLTSITIPDSVTNIGNWAFMCCSSLTSVTIPDSVISIGYAVFDDCSNLENINVNEQNNYYSSHDGVLFNKDITQIIAYPLGKNDKSYTIPDSVISIGDYTFISCKSLTSITIPDCVTSIGEGAFMYCEKLTSITIPDGVTSISDYTFYNCYSLTSITIPDGITNIGEYAFRYCESLTSITIPSSVTSIDTYAFYGCDKDLLVFYVVEGSYADTWATENGWTVSYISEEETTEETTEAVLRGLDVYFNDSSVIYNVDEGTYSSDSISLCGYASFWYLFTDLADSELGYPKNVSVEITLPEGFYFGSEDNSEGETKEDSEDENEETEDSGENTRTKVLTYEEITGTNYITETVYLDNPSRGTYTVTVNVSGDNVEEKTVTCNIVVVNNEFQLNQYRANYLLKSSIPESVESYINGTYDTPSTALEASAEENGLYWATSAWRGFMDTFNAFDKPSSITDYTFEEKDIYEAIIMDLFECSVDYNIVEYIKNEQYKTNTKLLNTVLSEMKLAYNYDFTSTMDISSMSDNEKALVEEAMAKYFKEENMDIAALSDVTKFIGDAVDYASDLQSLIENVSSYYEINKLSTAMEEIMQDMYDKCPSDNLALKAALLECITVMNSSNEAFAAEMCTYIAASAGKKVAEAGIDALWSNVKTSFSVANPEAFVLMMSYKASTCITTLFFNADSIEENFCKIVALMNTEALVKEVYYNEKSTYKSSVSEETAAVYNNMIDVMFNMLETDCDNAKDFAKAVNNSLASKISAFLGDSSVDDFITQVENIKNSYSGLHEQSLKNWISELEVDYPSQYANYKYILELSGDELTKAYKIECPVDVYVYDTDGVCVGYVKANKPYCRSDADITIGVNGDAKTIYMYGQNEYTIVYKGNDSGSMDITITEYDSDNKATRNVYFNDISLTNGLTYTSEEKANMSSYTLTATSGRSIEADYDSADSSAETYTITLTNGYFTDSPAFTAELHAGEKVEVAAFMFDGSEFSSWTSDIGNYIFDDTDSVITKITMPACDVNITANISSSNDDPDTTETTTETSTETTTKAVETSTTTSTETSTETTTKATETTSTEATTETTTTTSSSSSSSSGGSGGGGGSSSTCTIKLVPNNGVNSSTKYIKKNSTLAEPDTPVYDGYTFTGWYTDSDCTTLYDFSAKVTSSFTLYGGWKEADENEAEDEEIETEEEETQTETEESVIEKIVKVVIGSAVVTVETDGQESTYTMDTAPYIQSESSSTLVPLRFVAVAVYGDEVDNADSSDIVTWNADTKTASISVGNDTISFTAGSEYMSVNGKDVLMSNGVKAEITDGRMFIPFRALGEALGVDVDWNSDSKTAIYNAM